MAWLYQLDRHQQAALLANPHGFLPASVVERIADRTDLARRDETPQRARWQLRSAEANMLEDERLRLDDWWTTLSPAARAELLATRHTAVPEQYREAVLDMVPGGGMRSTVDLSDPFRASGIVAAYLEMVHDQQRSAPHDA